MVPECNDGAVHLASLTPPSKLPTKRDGNFDLKYGIDAPPTGACHVFFTFTTGVCVWTSPLLTGDKREHLLSQKLYNLQIVCVDIHVSR